MSTRVLVLTDGDLPSLVAAASAAEQAVGVTDPAKRPILLPFAASAGQLTAIAAQARALALSVLPAIAAAHPSSDGEAQSHDLLAALYGAARAGIDTVLWPVSAATGETVDVDLASTLADRALLVGRLVALDESHHARPSVRLETPYLDLTDTQLADLAADLAVPLNTVWWWGSSNGDAARARARWSEALTAAGWPLVTASA